LTISTTLTRRPSSANTTAPEVEYAEPNYEIELDAVEDRSSRFFRTIRSSTISGRSRIQDSGRQAGRDISATLAWATTTGSDKVVVACSTAASITRTKTSREHVDASRYMAPYHDERARHD
jgi:hypothetical protein